MMEKVLSRSVRLLFTGSVAAAGLTMLAQPAVAQDAHTEGTVQRVEVTGSSIKRASSETASPVQVISSDDLMKSGKLTVADYLQTLTSDGAGSLPTGFGNGFAAGSTAISLRGLGATSTLVLLNGRRMAQFARADDGQKSFTDLSTIPMQIVERIEILKDGASSTYGADAIAGVVNIILRKDVQGTTFKADTGISGYGDQQQHKASLTYGHGSLDTDKYNVVFNAEYTSSESLLNKDRADRAYIGHGDLRPYGYPIGTQFASGYIAGNNNAAASPAGSIRNPTTLAYTSLPGCSALSTASPQDPNGGCLWYQDQFRSMQPSIDGINLYGRGTWQINADTQAYTEFGYSKRNTEFTLTPPSITPTVAFPATAANPSGVINYGSGANTAIVLAPTHPQNPYGVPVRVRYAAFDVGPSKRSADNEFYRFVAGLKGTMYGWDYDTGYVHSESKLHLDYSNMLNMKVVAAALGDPTSKFFPYFLGSQAYKNPASLYAAMVTNATSDSTTKLDMIDFKVSRELFALPGGNLGIAIGAEHRHESLDNPSLSGTQDGSINASYVAAKGTNNISAIYMELLAPVLKTVELSGAVRYDKYSAFNSTTPKVGAKWTPIKSFALRGTYSEGFRAPGPAESNTSSQSTGTATVPDPVRCPDGVHPLPGATSTDCAASVAAVKLGNPNLSPEKSKGYTLGLVWDPFNDTNLALDGWKIRRTDEINPLSYIEAAALPTAIRADNNLTINGVVVPNTGTLLITKAPYHNSSFTEVKGVDLDVKQRVRLGDYGRLNLNLNWTHVASWVRQEAAVRFQYAGTHGNCDTSDCAGTPKDKINVSASWDKGDYNVTAQANYRSDMHNTAYAGGPCASTLASGAPGPNASCTIASFTSIDLSGRWNVNKKLQLFASIQNLFDKLAPLDPLTYGGMSYNPMDASGAIGRYFRVGASYKFN